MYYVVLLQWIVLLFHRLWIHVLDDHPSADKMPDFLFVDFLNDMVILLLHSLFFHFIFWVQHLLTKKVWCCQLFQMEWIILLLHSL